MGKSGAWLSAVKKVFAASKDPAQQKQSETNFKHPSLTNGRTESTEIQQKSFKEKNRWSFRRSSRNLQPTSQLHLYPGNHINQYQDLQNRNCQTGGGPNLSGKGHVEKGSVRNQNQNKQALAVAVATAAAAEAAVAAAQAAAQVVKLTGTGRSGSNSNYATPAPNISIIARRDHQELAAIRIQAAFRAYLARRTFRTLRGLARLQALAQGRVGQKQTTATMRCMQALGRAQAAVRGRSTTHLYDDTGALGATMPHPTWNTEWEPNESHQSAAVPTAMNEKGIPKKEAHKFQQGSGWDHSTQTIEQIQARVLYRQEASVKRERAMAYAFAHQQLQASSCYSKKASSTPQLGWNWLERWMAAKPWENRRPSLTKDVLTEECTASLKPISTMSSRKASPMRRGSAPTPSTPLSHRHPAISRIASPARSISVGTPILGNFSAPATRMCKNPFSMSSQAHSLANSSMRDDISLASYSGTPSYMASTESARARLRSRSTPKQRVGGTRSASASVHSDDVGANEQQRRASCRKRLSFTNGDSSSARNFLSLKASSASSLQRNHSFETYNNMRYKF